MGEMFVRRGLLRAPKDFWSLSREELYQRYNGCGPSGNWLLEVLTFIVPDNLLGCDISMACNIHDFCWEDYEVPRKEADNLFLENMSALVEEYGGFLQPVRDWMAFQYYLAVKNYSGYHPPVDLFEI